MTFSNIFDNIESKLIGLKCVGSSISPYLWSSIVIECFHGFGNTFACDYRYNNNNKLLKQDYKIQLANNKIQMAWLTSWLVVG